ncbi:tropinesterase [Candidatus Phycosocius bacilliformis]|uniref:Tropinesterase n=1 Tax=Candidatus Phycosocius bacilliformis TaxID=1445552 RepID=A0A2P2E687_9PROT|nr:alpha/beta hydrolase [Candidatus Phycosocius bacilliformis]GBF56557.1 tropinesterase [Candidatus Phycosocius bacilliformis]
MNEHMIAGQDGVKTYVADFDPVGAYTGPPVLCLHGLTRNHKDFQGVIEPIRRMGRRVLALDIRGRGRSDWDPNPANYTPLIYAQDVLNILNRLGLKRAVFLGTSMGGIITMLVAAFSPATVAGAILNDIGPEVDPVGIQRIQSYVGKIGKASSWDEAARMIASIGEQAFPGRSADFWLDFAHKTCIETADGIVFDYDPAIAQVAGAGDPAAIPTLWEPFAALNPIPTAVIRGALSDLLSVDIVARMKQAKPDLITVEVPEVGHAPTLEEPEAWTAIEAIIRQTR